MARKAFKPEQIINKLREAEVLISQGATISEASRKLGITEQTYSTLRLRGRFPFVAGGIPAYLAAPATCYRGNAVRDFASYADVVGSLKLVRLHLAINRVDVRANRASWTISKVASPTGHISV